MNTKIFRVLAIILGIIGILLVGYFLMTDQIEKSFIAMIPTILAIIAQRYSQDLKS